MDHDYLDNLKRNHPTLKLLAADNVPLIISFLFRVYIQPNQRSASQSDLTTRLDDFLFQLHEIYGASKYPKTARQYLEDWSNGNSPFLRKYYTDISDEPEFDLTPATDKAIEWLQSLEERQFVGTESRLLTVFALLREIVSKTERDPQQRIAELEQQRDAIDGEIEQIRSGIFAAYDSTQVKERFLQVEETARRLLADFRQVEYNFRTLDRETRESIAISDMGKGELLDEIFNKQDVIWDNDQGKSFRAFWEFLMSNPRQMELANLLEKVYGLEEVQQLSPDLFLANIKYALLEAGEKVYKTNNQLVEQLRKFLDDQAYLENRRIMDLVKEVEKQAIEFKENPPAQRNFGEIEDIKPQVNLVMSRGLFLIPKISAVNSEQVTVGESSLDVDALFIQNYVDEQELRANIRRALQNRSQISLAQLVVQFPVRKGLAEVVSYLSMADKDTKALIDDTQTETISLNDASEAGRRIVLPKVIFVR
ncbi:MAG: DUF3375 domain-containing protein [Thermodesulfobacteriota bacterium]|nr:DUF3375 domain-containing protein [Thermodesulfobacteriota bacterium]